MRKNLILRVLMLFAVVALMGCSAGSEKIDEGDEVLNQDSQNIGTYVCISQEEAKELMETETNYIILDVRTQEEYDSGHIPGAICIPNETIGTEPPVELPDKEQLILIYCRSGNRSKQASEKLAKMGYTNIKEFGGINTWTGEVEVN